MSKSCHSSGFPFQLIEAKLLSGNRLPFAFQSHTSASSILTPLLLFQQASAQGLSYCFPVLESFSLSYLHICMLFPSLPLGFWSNSLYQNSYPWLHKRATTLLLLMTPTFLSFSPDPHLEPPKCTCAHMHITM